MPDGIRATVEFTSGELCPVVAFSERAGTTIDTVAPNVRATDAADCVTEFAAETDHEDAELDPLFAHGSTRRYRFSHGDGLGCPCECLGEFGCPVARYVAREGRLTLVFHAADYEELRDVVGELRERFPDVDIKRFVRSPSGEVSRDDVLVDRSRLTERQFEVVETAYEMGYFEQPRRANATEIAAELDIDPSTFREHLAAAERKVLGALLDRGRSG